MTVFEYGRDIVIVDMGLQFPEEDMPGIDYIIPNAEYLRGKEKNIRGVIITHGHYDHIGAIPHLIPKLGNPPIYATELTRGIIAKRQEEYKNPINIKTVKKIDRLKLGVFDIEFFHVNHTIPDAVGVVDRNAGRNSGRDRRFQIRPQPGRRTRRRISRKSPASERKEFWRFCRIRPTARHRDIRFPNQPSRKTLEEVFEHTEGRIIAATFAALISRIQQLIQLSEKYGPQSGD